MQQYVADMQYRTFHVQAAPHTGRQNVSTQHVPVQQKLKLAVGAVCLDISEEKGLLAPLSEK